MKVRIDLDLTQGEIDRLSHLAIIRGWLRENERGRWKTTDTKEAVRYAIERLIVDYCEKKS